MWFYSDPKLCFSIIHGILSFVIYEYNMLIWILFMNPCLYIWLTIKSSLDYMKTYELKRLRYFWIKCQHGLAKWCYFQLKYSYLKYNHDCDASIKEVMKLRYAFFPWRVLLNTELTRGNSHISLTTRHRIYCVFTNIIK